MPIPGDSVVQRGRYTGFRGYTASKLQNVLAAKHLDSIFARYIAGPLFFPPSQSTTVVVQIHISMDIGLVCHMHCIQSRARIAQSQPELRGMEEASQPQCSAPLQGRATRHRCGSPPWHRADQHGQGLADGLRPGSGIPAASHFRPVWIPGPRLAGLRCRSCQHSGLRIPGSLLRGGLPSLVACMCVGM